MNKRLSKLAATAAFVGLSMTHLTAQGSTLEVVQSVPLETSLAVPGIRDAQGVWLEMIRAAQSTIDLEQFYISDQEGEALRPVLDAIRDASDRGVRVRVITDAKMDKTYPHSVRELATGPNAEARLVEFTPGVQHAKFFVIDGKASFVGSQNFDWRALSHIHEIGLRIVDTVLAQGLLQVFEKDWADARAISRGPQTRVINPTSAEPSAPLAQLGARLVASPEQANPVGVPDSITALSKLLASAKKSIQVQVMDYSTTAYTNGARWRVLDDALRAAAKRGVQVKLAVDQSHVKSAKTDLKGLAAIEGIEVRGVTIPAWSGGAIPYARLVHSKYVVIDEGASAWLGTENWSRGYFMDSRDVGLIVSDTSVAGQLNRVFAKVWESPYAKSLFAPTLGKSIGRQKLPAPIF